MPERLLAAFLIAVCAAVSHADAYDVRIPFKVSREDGIGTARLTLATSDSSIALTGDFSASRGIVLRGGRDTCAISNHLRPGDHMLVLKQRGEGVRVCLDGRYVSLLDGQHLTKRVRGTLVPGGGIGPQGRIRAQRSGRIRLDDDFARVADSAPLWEIVSGRFALNTSLNPGSSMGAFQFWGDAAGGQALAVAKESRWFWDDYEASVSARVSSLPASWGLVFHYRGEDNYHLLLWSGKRGGAGTLRVIRRQSGEDVVLGMARVALAPGQWRRLSVVTHRDQLRAFVDGVEMVRVWDEHLTGGKVGLCVRGCRDVYFDDVRIRSVGDGKVLVPTLPFGPCEQEWSDLSSKKFLTDKFMTQWSHPRSLWQVGTRSGWHWFRTRLFREARFSWKYRPGQRLGFPRHPVELALFADPVDTSSGYRVELTADSARLLRAGREVASTPAAVAAPKTLTFSAVAGHVRFSVNGKQVFDWRDPSPLTAGRVGACLGSTMGMRLSRPDWRDTAQVLSSNRLDYSFEHAPTAWRVQSGDWKSLHRWACVPKWSFFGGRGRLGPVVSNGNATLWNLRRFQGDFDLEIYAAPMEGTPQRVHFEKPVTVNVAFSADGEHLDSGYMLLFGAYDTPSLLYRAGREVARWDGRVDPSLRRRPMPWYHKVTRVWQQLRIQRIGGRIIVEAAAHDENANFMGLERIFDFQDPTPLTGERFGVWTWGANGLALARATMSYERSAGVAGLGAHSGNGESIADSSSPRGSYTRITNPESGNLFLHPLSDGPVNLRETGAVEFAIRTKDPLALSIMCEIRGHTGAATVLGKHEADERVLDLGVAHTFEMPDGWRYVRLDFPGQLHRFFPRGPMVLDRVWLASPYRTLEQIAGLGVNRAGSSYDLSPPLWKPTGTKLRPPQGLVVRMHGRVAVDCFEGTTGEWARLGGVDGALVSLDRRQGTRDGCIRLLNTRVGGPAGAWIRRTSYPLEDFPGLSFECRLSEGVETNLIVKANGKLFEVQGTGLDATWPVIGRMSDFVADGTWRRVHFDLGAALRSRFPRQSVRIEALAFADSARMTTPGNTAYWFDNVQLVPALPSDGVLEVSVATMNGKALAGVSWIADESPDTVPAPKVNGAARFQISGKETASWLHVRARKGKQGWSDTVHLRLAPAVGASPVVKPAESAVQAATTGGVPAPFVSHVPSNRLCLNEFEWQRHPENPAVEAGEFSIRRMAWALARRDDAATGNGCMELVNLGPRGFFSTYFRRTAWDPRQWPMVAFDYKFEQPGCALNFSLLANEAMTMVEWTGTNAHAAYFRGAVIGKTSRAQQDGQWHHVEFDLGRMILDKRFPDPSKRGGITVSELSLWATNHHGGGYVNPADARILIDNFVIFSPSGRNPIFHWRMPSDTPVGGYSHVLDSKPDTVPAETVSDTRSEEASFHDLEPGRWWFHVRACSKEGAWGPTTHLPIEISP
ncbi:MAG: hypothetical protein KAI66_08500 [Lentisphaeria bacterium]|nr:hypothetical protein [Lentisphaeria bacterium]